jgi:hypothetical protein
MLDYFLERKAVSMCDDLLLHVKQSNVETQTDLAMLFVGYANMIAGEAISEARKE